MVRGALGRLTLEGPVLRRLRVGTVVTPLDVSETEQALLERWWSGSNGAHLVDRLSCSLFVVRMQIDDDVFLAQLARPHSAPIEA